MKLEKAHLKKMNDGYKLLISYFVVLFIFQIVFFAESFLIVFRTVSVLFWLFILPGIGITYLWDLNFVERLALSVAISASILGIGSYYLGLIGIHIKLSAILLPLICIIVGVLIIARTKILRMIKSK